MRKDFKSVEKHRNFPFITPPPVYKYDDTLSIVSETSSEKIIRSRINHGGCWSACKAIIVNYGRESNIHGVRYVFEMHRPLYEKCLWLIFLIISAYFAGSLIRSIYHKFEQTPVIIVFDEKLVPIHVIPFPTVTICPEIKVERYGFNFTSVAQQIQEEIKKYKSFKNDENYTQKQINSFASLLHICEMDIINQFGPYMPDGAGFDVAHSLVNISVPKNDTAPLCKWNKIFYICHELINIVTTDEGICFQFNGLNPKDMYRDPRPLLRNAFDIRLQSNGLIERICFWYCDVLSTENSAIVNFAYFGLFTYVSYTDLTENDFNKNTVFEEMPLNNITGSWSLDTGYVGQGYNSYPQRTVIESQNNGFFLVLQAMKHNLEYTCRSFAQGYKVFINSPESVPLTTGNYILVPHGEEIMVRVSPQYITSTTDLYDFTPEKRQCYFNKERFLRFFKFYSQSNCQTECLANFTISKCGCVKFWMPKPLDVPVCRVADINCYTDAQEELTLVLQNQSMQKAIDPNINIMCDCMPGCTSLDYNFEISSNFYDMLKTLKAFRETYEEYPDLLSGSRLAIYFKEHQFTAIKRTVRFSVTTLISNTGGLCGLFLGLTFFSIVEFVYFFSFRLYDNLRQRYLTRKRKQKTQLAWIN